MTEVSCLQEIGWRNRGSRMSGRISVEMEISPWYESDSKAKAVRESGESKRAE